MKKAKNNFLLWQKKRNELPVNNDPEADWDQMASLLDEDMPVAKKPGHFKGFRTLPAILITFSAAAMIYVAGNVYSLEKHHRAVKHHFHKGIPMQPGPHFAGSQDSLHAKTDTGNLLSGGKNALDDSSTGGAVSIKSNPSASTSPAGNTKSANALTATGKPGHVLNGLGHLSNPLRGAQQNASRLKSLIANNKTTISPGGSPYNSGQVTSGHGYSNHNKRIGENNPGSNQVNNNAPRRTTGSLNSINNWRQDEALAPALQPALRFDLSLNKIQPLSLPVLNSRLKQAITQAGNQTKGSKKSKPRKPQDGKTSNIDWGILMGVNTSGSFTPKSQNANFYGIAPIDPWFGLFVSYKINTNWAIAPQVHFFSPQIIVTSYTHANQSQVDSGQSLAITASRKMYAVSMPIYTVYNTGSGLLLKAGPVINFPVKQVNTSSVLLPASIRTDTSYYKNISAILNATQYQQNVNFGFSAGAAYQFKRFIFEATYLKSISGYGISSGLGAYKSYNGTFQFTIGFQLDKVKP